MEKQRKHEDVQKRLSIPFFRNWLLSISKMDNATLGAFLKCCIGFCETGVTPTWIKDHEDNLAISMMFENFKVAEEENYRKWLLRCQRNKENRHKGTTTTGNESEGQDIKG